jgi:glycerol kinase
MQIQCDVLGVPVVRPRTVETTALGAAYLAGLATGVWPDRASIARTWAAERRFEPSAGAADLAARRGAWDRAVERARGWARDAGA